MKEREPGDVISMEDVKEKLKNYVKHKPDCGTIGHNFCAYLAKELPDELTPEGFVWGVWGAADQLEDNAYDPKKRPEVTGLVGGPKVRYNIFRLNIPTIAEAVCPKDFAKKVREVYEEIIAEIEKEE